MITLKKPAELNGEQLAQELKIDERKIFATEHTLEIDLDESKKDQVESIVKNHKPKPAEPISIDQKLAKAGITLSELREALGL